MTSQFVSTWYVLDNSAVELPVPTPVTVSVNWGDGSINGYSNTTDISHTYTNGTGIKVISISGGPLIWDVCGAGADVGDLVRNQLRDISECGGILTLGNSGEQFAGCTQLTWSATDKVLLTNVNTLFQCFKGDTSLGTDGHTDFQTWDTRNVTEFTDMFNGTNVFTDGKRPKFHNPSYQSWFLPDASYIDQIITDVSARESYTTRSVGSKQALVKVHEYPASISTSTAKAGTGIGATSASTDTQMTVACF